MKTKILYAALLASVCALAQAGSDEGDKAYNLRQYTRAINLYLEDYQRTHDTNDLYNAACSYSLLGNKERAIALLQQAQEAGFMAIQLETDKDLAFLRGDPRWTEIVQRNQQRIEYDRRLYDSRALESSYTATLSEDERVLGLSRVWSEIKYNFAYTDTLRQLDWDARYLEMLGKVRAARDTYEYYRLLSRWVSELHDGHTTVTPPEPLFDQWYARPAMRLRLIEGRVFVGKVFTPALKKLGVTEGQEIIAINKQPVSAYAEQQVIPYVSASTQANLQAHAYEHMLLAGKLGDAVQLTLQDSAGKTRTLTVPRIAFAEQKQVFAESPFSIRELDDGVVYVGLKSFADEGVVRAYLASWPLIAHARAVILDLRDNIGGNPTRGFRILATLVDHPFAVPRWDTRDYRPSFRAWQRTMPDYVSPAETWPNDADRHYAGPVVVLSNALTFSAAEYFLASFDQIQRGMLVGEASGGSSGMTLTVGLPGGGRLSICTNRDTYPDGRSYIARGIAPQKLVKMTVADLRAGRDPVLAAALQALHDAPASPAGSAAPAAGDGH